jgi:hypothetical protein
MASSRPAVTYHNSIFINCPFDEDYKPIFLAIIFAVEDLGFAARCALERDDSGEGRLHKIMDIIGRCKYGIHDLSRVDVNSPSLPHLNMPFELGIFFGCQHYGIGKHSRKVALILDTEKYRYLEFITDLRGHDIKEHNNHPEKAIQAVRKWLGTTPKRTKKHGAVAIWNRYQRFQQKLPTICSRMNITPDELTASFPEYVQVVKAFIIELDQKPSTR